MSVKTGEILGMASMVSFTSNDSLNVGKSVNKLSLITDLYEPGSTFKLVTAAASLEEGVENKFSIIATQSGEYVHGDVKIKDAHKHNSNLSFQQVVEQSSNVGMIQIAKKLGSPRFYKYARDFGFGIYSGIDFPGEVRGMLKRPIEFSPVSLQFMAIGYEVLVTAIQMTNAFSCIANNGVMMKPFIVKKVLSADGKIIKENFSTVVRNVVSKTTANGMTELLYGVVERGTGKDAKIENLKIAGKTGTSQRVVEGKHSKQSYTASFIGYFPADNPQIVISVIIDEPKSGDYYGGKVAAPIFKKIAEQIIAVNGLFEENQPRVLFASNENDGQNLSENESPVKELNFKNFEIEDARKILNERNINFEIDGPKNNSIVSSQQIIEEDSGVKFMLKTIQENSTQEKNELNKIPELRGMSMRNCVKALSLLGIDYKITGSGKVVSQNISAGTVLQKNISLQVICEE
jgi:membrane peptidoglycan carboxypeptidase